MAKPTTKKFNLVDSGYLNSTAHGPLLCPEKHQDSTLSGQHTLNTTLHRKNDKRWLLGSKQVGGWFIKWYVLFSLCDSHLFHSMLHQALSIIVSFVFTLFAITLPSIQVGTQGYWSTIFPFRFGSSHLSTTSRDILGKNACLGRHDTFRLYDGSAYDGKQWKNRENKSVRRKRYHSFWDGEVLIQFHCCLYA